MLYGEHRTKTGKRTMNASYYYFLFPIFFREYFLFLFYETQCIYEKHQQTLTLRKYKKIGVNANDRPLHV